MPKRLCENCEHSKYQGDEVLYYCEVDDEQTWNETGRQCSRYKYKYDP